LKGTVTIRHMGRAYATQRLQALLAAHTEVFYRSFAINRWLGTNLELLGACGE
jgi:hypothetical protein